MKKKIALLLAVIMSFSVLPATTLFAANDTKAHTDNILWGIAPQSKLKQKAAERGDDNLYSKLFEAPNLIVTLNDDPKTTDPMDSFRLRLDKAKWNINYISEGTYSHGIITLGDIEGDREGLYTYEALDGSYGYTFRLDKFNDGRIATITDIKGTVEDVLYIPLAVDIDDVTDLITVEIYDNYSIVKQQILPVASTIGSGTTLRTDAVSGRELIKLNPIRIIENRAGAIQKTGGHFEIVAPEGYRFANNPETWTWDVVFGLGIIPYTGNAAIGTGNYYYMDGVYKVYVPDTRLKNFNTFTLDGSGGGADNSTGNISGTNNASADIPNGSGTNGLTSRRAIDLSNGYQDHYKLIIPQNAIKSSINTQKTGEIYISGIVIEPIDDRYVVTDKELFIEIKGVSSDFGISPGKVKVATVVDWGINYTAAADKKTVVSGLLNQSTAKVTVEETLQGAWLPNNSYGSATFTLPEGVKINTIEFDAWDKISSATPKPGKIELLNSTAVGVSKYTSGCVTVDNDGRSFTIRGLEPDGGKAKVSFTLNVTVSPDFDGEIIDLELTGSAVPEAKNGAKVEIATVDHPITIDAKTTDIEIGYQSYKVGDVTITETATGRIGSGRLVISLADGSNGDLTFAPVTSEQVTVSDNIRATLVRSSNGLITFDVARGALNGEASITIKNLEVRVNRNVPWGSYDLVVYGDSVYKNYSIWGNQTTQTSGSRSPLVSFGDATEGYTAPYISVVTAGSNSATFKNVKITADSNTIIVGGEPVELDVAPFIDEESDSFLVPVRFVAEALGIPEEDVLWDRSTSTATILSRSNGRTVKFVSGSDTMYVNDGAQTMLNANGQPVKAKIVDERMFIPFRFIGNALGITNDKISWDPETRTAEFNPVVE